MTATEPTVLVPLPDVQALGDSPVAIIVRLDSGPRAVRLRLAIGDRELSSVSLEAGRARRVDVASMGRDLRGQSLRLEGDATGWALTYLEVANVHGHSDGPLSLVVVPAIGGGGDAVAWWWVLVTAGALLVAGQWFERPSQRFWRAAYLAGAGVALTVFAVVLAMDRVTPYRVWLTPMGFCTLTALLYAPAIVEGSRRAHRSRRLESVRRVAPHLVAAALVATGVMGFYAPDTGFTALIMFGEEFEERAVPVLRAIPHAVETPAGYDGQFYAQRALDPTLTDPATARALDAPGYRARRVLLPAVAYLLGLGQPAWILQAYALINPICWALLGWLLLRWLPPGTVRPTAAWCACMLSHGLLASLRLSLTDGPSVLLIALGVVALEAGRPWWGAAAFGASGLARETNLIAGSALVTPDRRVTSAAGRLVILVLPLLVWTLVLSGRGIPIAGGGPRNFDVPLAAYAGKWMSSLNALATSGSDPLVWSSLLTLAALTVQLTALTWWREWRSAWWRIGIGYGALLAVMGVAVWEGHPGAVTRVLLPMTVAFNVLLPTRRGFWPLWIAGNANLLFGPAELGWRLWR